MTVSIAATNVVSIGATALERLKASGTAITHKWDEEGVIDTIETQVVLAPGIELHYFDTDHSSALAIQGTADEIQFYMNERLAEMFLRYESVSAAELFGEIVRASV